MAAADGSCCTCAAPSLVPAAAQLAVAEPLAPCADLWPAQRRAGRLVARPAGCERGAEGDGHDG